MTVKQKQALLLYMGYYVGEIDGVWGTLSKTATLAFQRDYNLTDDGLFGAATEDKILKVIASGEAKKTTQTTTFWDEIVYFDRSEYACKCGKCGGFPVEPQEKLVRVEDRLRKHFGVPVTNSSGVRCKTHNTAVGGVAGSRHLRGKAVDFCVAGKSANEVLTYVKKQPEIRYAYAIDSSFVHMDID